jgi:hypothetical protein
MAWFHKELYTANSVEIKEYLSNAADFGVQQGGFKNIDQPVKFMTCESSAGASESSAVPSGPFAGASGFFAEASGSSAGTSELSAGASETLAGPSGFFAGVSEPSAGPSGPLAGVSELPDGASGSFAGRRKIYKRLVFNIK